MAENLTYIQFEKKKTIFFIQLQMALKIFNEAAAAQHK